MQGRQTQSVGFDGMCTKMYCSMSPAVGNTCASIIPLEYTSCGHKKVHPSSFQPVCLILSVYLGHTLLPFSLFLTLSVSFCLSVYSTPFFLLACLSFSLSHSIYLPACLPVYLPIYPSIHPPIHPSTHPSIHPSIHLSIYLSIYPSGACCTPS